MENLKTQIQEYNENKGKELLSVLKAGKSTVDIA